MTCSGCVVMGLLGAELHPQLVISVLQAAFHMVALRSWPFPQACTRQRVHGDGCQQILGLRLPSAAKAVSEAEGDAQKG